MKRRKWKIKWATDLEVHRDHGILKEVLAVLGHPEALVTDESSIFDFIDFHDISEEEYDAAEETMLKRFENHFEIAVPEDGNIARTIQCIRNRRTLQ